MFIEAAEKMGKTWLMIKMERLCEAAELGIPVARVDFRNPLDLTKITDYVALIRLLANRLQSGHYFGPLDALIDRIDQVRSSGGSSRISSLSDLADQISLLYSLGELRRLALQLDLEFEELRGETRTEKASELVKHFYRRNTLNQLMEKLKSDRSRFNWQPYFDALPLQDSSSREGDESLIRILPSRLEEDQQLEQQVCDTFFDCLASLVAGAGRVMLLFDAYEEAPQEARRFIVEQLLPHLLDERLHKMVVIIMGRKTPDISDLNLNHLVVETDLDPFTVEHVRDFMKSRNIQEDPPDWTWKGLHLLRGGVPGDLALMADRLTARASKHDPFFD
ncbi:hypothetical protein KFU94_31575 [Chloroflexi bacterium TSY]|nr:hypothetical protein [Chloroflexi bacterium TSY]